MDRSIEAVKYHKNGFACSQAVLACFADKFNLDLTQALKLSCGFGGGIGRMGKTCGALSGAIMVLGLKYGMSDENNTEAKTNTYDITAKIISKFKQIHKSSICNNLLGYDIRDPNQRLIIKEKNLSSTICDKIINDTVKIVEELIGI